MSRGSGAWIQGALEYAFYAVAVLYFWLFATWNWTEKSTLTLWFDRTSRDVPVVLPVILAFAAGIVMQWLVSALGTLRRVAEIRRARREIVTLRSEITGLRNAALSAPIASAAAPGQASARS
jgi:uncharacterized integral membrane protein